MLNVIMLNAIMLNVIMMNVIMLSVIMLNVIMLNVILLSVVVLLHHTMVLNEAVKGFVVQAQGSFIESSQTLSLFTIRNNPFFSSKKENEARPKLWYFEHFQNIYFLAYLLHCVLI